MRHLLYALGLGTLLAVPAAAQDPPQNQNPNDRQRPATTQDRNTNQQQQQQRDNNTQQRNNNERAPAAQDNRNTNPQDNNTQPRNTNTQDNRNTNPQDRNPNAQPRDNTTQPGTPRDNNQQRGNNNAGAAQGNNNANANRVQGRVVRVGNNQFVVQTQDGRNVTVFTNPQTRYALNNRAAQFSDVRVGSNLGFTYTTQGDQWYADNVTFLPAPIDNTAPVVQQPAPNAQVIEGQIVRVIGQDQVVVRTADGKEVILYVGPQTTYTWNNQPGQFTNLVPGAPIQANYEVVGNRQMARRILGGPRR